MDGEGAERADAPGGSVREVVGVGSHPLPVGVRDRDPVPLPDTEGFTEGPWVVEEEWEEVRVTAPLLLALEDVEEETVALLAALCDALLVLLAVGVNPEVAVVPSLKVPRGVSLGLIPEDLEGTGSIVTMDDSEEVEEAVKDRLSPLDLVGRCVDGAVIVTRALVLALKVGTAGEPLAKRVLVALLDGEGGGGRLRVLVTDPVPPPTPPPPPPPTPLPEGLTVKVESPAVTVGVVPPVRVKDGEEEVLPLSEALGRELGLGTLELVGMGEALVLEDPDGEPLIKEPTGVAVGSPIEGVRNGVLEAVPMGLCETELVMVPPWG
jgi:hypothetical protein